MFRINSRIQGIAATSLLCVMALSACGGDAASSKSNADLLKEAAANMKAATSYHLDANIDQDGQAIKLAGDIDIAKKNLKLDVDSSGMKISVITVDGKSYLSMDGGTTYTESDQGTAITDGLAGFTGMWDSFKTDQVDKAKDALKDGTPATEKIEGVDSKHITANAKDLSILNTNTASDKTPMEGTLELWLGPTDKPFIRQMKIDGTQDSKPIKGTLTWSKINEAMTITAPPTK
ncbi:MAG: LppX_LprAFG lipoprotein [Chloroflexia bacterium]